MSRDKIFFLHNDFVSKHPQLKEKAFVALNAALVMFDNNVKADTVEDRFSFGLNLLELIDKKEEQL